MRATLLVGALLVAGCAGQPSNPVSAPAVVATSTTPAGYVAVTAPVAPNSDQAKADAKRATDAKKDGYTVVNKEGKTLYCSTEFRTGSHVVKDTSCLTAEELDTLHDNARRQMDNFRGSTSGTR